MQLKKDFNDASGVHIEGAWSVGARQFTANEPIREPSDLEGMRMRFPGSPQFLLNAKALGAKATEVAYEELYLALQQGVVDGQENPITNIDASNLVEVQDYISMSSHAAELEPDRRRAGLGRAQPASSRMCSTTPWMLRSSKMPGLRGGRRGRDHAEVGRTTTRSKVVDDVDIDAFSSPGRRLVPQPT